MKITKAVIVSLVLLVLVSALYRIFPNRPYGFAPQYAMAIFGGVIFRKNKSWAFILPLLSMFLSDLLYEVLYNSGASVMPGFYEGQWQNYLLIGLLASIGFLIKKVNVLNVFIASIASPTVYFLLSNLVVWAGGGGWHHPKTFDGLMLTYQDALPFYPNSLYATVFFSAILFGVYYSIKNYWLSQQTQAA